MSADEQKEFLRALSEFEREAVTGTGDIASVSSFSVRVYRLFTFVVFLFDVLFTLTLLMIICLLCTSRVLSSLSSCRIPSAGL